MMRGSPANFTHSSHYRRGAIMGLTVAEAFMLVAFILLMLLVFWILSVDNKEPLDLSDLAASDLEALRQGSVPVAPDTLAELERDSRFLGEPGVRSLAEGAWRLSPESRRALTDLLDDPANAGAAVETLDRLRGEFGERSADEIADALALTDTLDPAGLSASDLEALGQGAIPVPPDTLIELERAGQLLGEPGIRSLAEGAWRLLPESRRALTDLLDDPATAGAAVETLERLRDEFGERSADEIANALKLKDTLDPAGLSASDLEALGQGAVPVPPDTLADLERDRRLLDEPGVRSLAEGAWRLSPESRRALTDMLNDPATAGAAVETLERLRGEFGERSAEEIANALKLKDTLDPAELSASDLEALGQGAVPVPPDTLADLERDRRLLDQPGVRPLAEGAWRLSPESRRALTDMLDDPATAGAAVETLDRLRGEFGERSAEEIANALKLKDSLDPAGLSSSDLETLGQGAVPVAPDTLADLERDRRLLGEPGVRSLAEGAWRLSPESRRALADLLDDPATAGAAVETLERLRDEFGERSADEIADALALMDDLDPYGELTNREIMETIQSLGSVEGTLNTIIQEEAQADMELVGNMIAVLGKSVRDAGGQIQPDGSIVFPDTFLFPVGDHVILPQFAKILDDFCPRWLKTLKASSQRREIDSILIEGHSSSEWIGDPENAWVRNLELSQRRAQSVLVHCLALVEGTRIGDWSHARLAATGFSSSRPIMAGEREDPRASRRVVFGIDLSRDQLLETLDSGATGGAGPVRTLRGVARVKDADTLEIQGYGVRLDGIDAIEKNQTCVRASGTRWPCGLRALRAVEAYLDGREVVCDRLRLGLFRFGGRCRVGGEDLNRWIVRQGWAFAYVKFSEDYVADEADARAKRRGIWRGEPPIPPWEWRRERRAAASPASGG